MQILFQPEFRDACSTMDCCPLLFIVVHCCSLLSIVVHCCLLLSIVIHSYSLLSIVIHCFPLLLSTADIIDASRWCCHFRIICMFWLNHSCVLRQFLDKIDYCWQSIQSTTITHSFPKNRKWCYFLWMYIEHSDNPCIQNTLTEYLPIVSRRSFNKSKKWGKKNIQ